MNDVSILFPLAVDAGSDSVELLSASASGARGQLLSSSLYDAVGHIAGTTFPSPPLPGAQGQAVYADLHVVAMRIDPCFAALEPDPHGTGCVNQLRLIVQEVRRSGGQDTTADSGLHLFYALSRAELEGIVRDVIALRIASGGTADLGSLQPHPLMVSEGQSGKFATGLRALILQHAGMSNLTRVAQMDGSSLAFFWNFFAFDVSDPATETIAPFVIPTLGDAGTQTFIRNFGQGTSMDGAFSPETSSSTDFAPLADAADAGTMTTAQRQTAFDALVSVENPIKFSANNIDCASCHLATPVEFLNAAPLFGLSETGNANAFVPDSRFVTAADLQPSFDGAAAFNVHAFSYGPDEVAGINQRTVNETAAVVAYLHSLE